MEPDFMTEDLTITYNRKTVAQWKQVLVLPILCSNRKSVTNADVGM